MKRKLYQTAIQLAMLKDQKLAIKKTSLGSVLQEVDLLKWKNGKLQNPGSMDKDAGYDKITTQQILERLDVGTLNGYTYAHVHI